MSASETITLSNWGNYPRIKAEICYPKDRNSLQTDFSKFDRLIARGNGKCYGDAALGPHIISTLLMNQLLEFDEKMGLVHCEAGILLAELLDIIVPAAWFFEVTPGIKNITVGGAIASDVHGKNHPSAGCFSNYLEEFELLRGNGDIVRCSKTQNQELFWQTCGGMGLTGIILTARFRLKRISSVYMEQTSVQAANLDALFEAFEQHQHPYAAGWVDCLARDAAFGRGVVYFAKHSTSNPTDSPLSYPHKNTRNVPFYAPSWLLNPLTIRMHNSILFSKAKSEVQLVDMDQYFYPLDRIRNWNRLYGRRGFIQYQFCLPAENSAAGIREVLGMVQKSKDLPFLSVMKRHGDRPAAAINSFPIRGYSLALDFPRTRTIFSLVKRLDEVVWAYGGKIYLAKDACSAPHMSRVDPSIFSEGKFFSALKARIANR